MAFPTVPTAAASTVLTGKQANTTATRTFPSLSGLTKNSGDLLIAIVVAYQTSTGTNAAFSGWTGGFTEFHDSATSTTMAIGCAYKWSTGSETGTFAVTQAGTITGQAGLIVMAIPGAHATSPPEAGGRASSTNSNSNPGSLAPSWGAEDTLWIALSGVGETSTGGSFQGNIGGPSGWTDYVETGVTQDVVGGLGAAVAFLQANATSEDPPTFNTDASNARWGAITIAVRPAMVQTFGDASLSVTGSLSATGTVGTIGDASLVGTATLAATGTVGTIGDASLTVTAELTATAQLVSQGRIWGSCWALWT